MEAHLKRLYGRVGFNFEYSLLIAIFVGMLLVLFNVFNRPDVKDGAAWFQGVGIIFTLIAALSIPAIQRKHAYLQNEEEYDLYTLKAYQVASEAVDGVVALKEIKKLFVSETDHKLILNGLDVLIEAIGSFEVSRMSSAQAAIALLRVKQQVKDASIIYATTLKGSDEKIFAMGLIESLADSAVKELAVLESQIPMLKKNRGSRFGGKIRSIFGLRNRKGREEAGGSDSP